MAKADGIIATGVNMQMCTAKCPCEGEDGSDQYKAYMHTTHEDTFNAMGRTKVGSDKQGKEDYADLVWGKKGSSYKSFMACLDKGKEQEVEGEVQGASVATV